MITDKVFTMERSSIIDALVDIYLNQEYWHRKKLSKEKAYDYFNRLVYTGNIITHIQGGELVGYVEFWRITFGQFGRIICHSPFSAYQEDVQNGNIAYVANTWIKPEYRNTQVYKALKLAFFQATYMCDYFVGEALRKKHRPVKVFKRSDFMGKYINKEGDNHG